ncbi:hypothetical protein [Scytonema sp. PCC 10023]|uniref:hypothetical protein n=1 Tax=Scytonema sp. PCC 10023 TaxID=1680591 RepID=UPI0039C6879C
MGKAKRRKQLTKSGSNITEETIKMAGPVQPKDEDLPPAIVWAIQFQGIHDYQQLFLSSLHFINRNFKKANYLFSKEQFDRVLQSLIDQKTLVFRDGGYYHHPDIQKKIDQQSATSVISNQ